MKTVKIVHLDEIEPMPIGESLWKPIRSTLEIEAFGVNAYVAEQAGTTVLAIGGPVGEPYEVAPWEYWFRVRRARALGDVEEARAIAEEGLARYPDDPTLRSLASK